MILLLVCLGLNVIFSTVLPNIRSQIESADLIVINKTELYPPETVDRTKKTIWKRG